MTVKELYDTLDENYEEVHSRLDNDEWIAKYLKKFQDGDYKLTMNRAINEGDWVEGFKMAHSIKGLALNLGLGRLADCSVVLAEELRVGAPKKDITGMLLDLNHEYDRVMEQIKKLE